VSQVFGLCFGFPSGGALLLGDAPLPSGVDVPAWTPLLPAATSFYTVELLGFDVEVASASLGGGGDAMLGGGATRTVTRSYRPVPLAAAVFKRGYGTVLDSGTTFTYLPTPAFLALSRLVQGMLGEIGFAYSLQVGRVGWAGGASGGAWRLVGGNANRGL
jgi:hypothetical protein